MNQKRPKCVNCGRDFPLNSAPDHLCYRCDIEQLQQKRKNSILLWSGSVVLYLMFFLIILITK